MGSTSHLWLARTLAFDQVNNNSLEISMRQSSNPNQKVEGHSHSRSCYYCTNGQIFLADQQCSVHGPLLQKTTNAFSPSVVYTSPSSMMKAAKAGKYTLDCSWVIIWQNIYILLKKNHNLCKRNYVFIRPQSKREHGLLKTTWVGKEGIVGDFYIPSLFQHCANIAKHYWHAM